VENGMLKPGREYWPHLTVKTDAGILRPRLAFKKRWPWMLIEAAMAAALICAAMVLRSGR